MLKKIISWRNKYLIYRFENAESLEKARLAEEIAILQDPRATEPLIKALGDINKDVRKASAKAVVQLKDPRTVDMLIKVLGDKNGLAQEKAAKVLGQLNDLRAVEPLIKALEDKRIVRDAAKIALEKMDVPEDIKARVNDALENERKIREEKKRKRKETKRKREENERKIREEKKRKREIGKSKYKEKKHIARKKSESLVNDYENAKSRNARRKAWKAICMHNGSRAGSGCRFWENNVCTADTSTDTSLKPCSLKRGSSYNDCFVYRGMNGDLSWLR